MDIEDIAKQLFGFILLAPAIMSAAMI